MFVRLPLLLSALKLSCAPDSPLLLTESPESKVQFYESLKHGATTPIERSAMHLGLRRWRDNVDDLIEESKERMKLSVCHMDAWYPLFTAIRSFAKPSTPVDCPNIGFERDWSKNLTKGLGMLLDGVLVVLKSDVAFNYLGTDRFIFEGSIPEFFKYCAEFPKALFVKQGKPGNKLVVEFEEKGFRAVLVGKLKIDKDGIWSEFAKDGKWMSSRGIDISRSDHAVMDKDTYLLMYTITEVEDLQKSLITAVSNLNVMKGKTIERAYELGETNKSTSAVIDKLIYHNRSLLATLLKFDYHYMPGQSIKYEHSCSAFIPLRGIIYNVDSPPEVMIFCKPQQDFGDWDVQEYEPKLFMGIYNRCMTLKATIQFDGKLYSSHILKQAEWVDGLTGKPVNIVKDENTIALIYEHDNFCDDKAVPVLKNLKLKLGALIQKRIEETPSTENCILLASQSRDHPLIVDKAEANACLMRQRHLNILAYLKQYLSTRFDASASRQIMKLKQLLYSVESMSSSWDSLFLNEIFKFYDEDMPMAYWNTEGSCFLNVVLQVFFATSSLRDSISTIPDVKLKNALEELARLKFDEKAAVASVLRFRESLTDWHFCRGGDHTQALKYVLKMIPAFLLKTEFLELTGTTLGETVQGMSWMIHYYTEVIYVSLKKAREGYRPRPDMEIEKEGKKFDLIATIQDLPNHTTAKVRVWSESEHRFKWYYMDNSIGKLIVTDPEADFKHKVTEDPTKRPIIDDQTSMLVYELRRERPKTEEAPLMPPEAPLMPPEAPLKPWEATRESPQSEKHEKSSPFEEPQQSRLVSRLQRVRDALSELRPDDDFAPSLRDE